MTLELLSPCLSICKLPSGAAIPDARPLFWAVTEQETSLVCPEEAVPADCLSCEAGWRALRVKGLLDFSLVGILSALTAPLAARGVGVFVVSTFDTDYILVREGQLVDAITALAQAGYEVIEALS